MTEPKPKVVELIIRPLQDGHTINLQAKVAEEDGTITDAVVESNSMQKELRIQLAHLQEAVIVAKVTGMVEYDAAQAAVVSKPLPEEPAASKASEKKNETHAKESKTSHASR